MQRWSAFFALLTSALVFWVTDARAQGQLSAYEASVLAEALGKVSGRIEPEPEGKRIESIDIVRVEVFDDRDPIPKFFNIFHWTSLESVVARELLFRPGSRYDRQRLEESARNLRGLRQFSLVLVVPMIGSTPDTVRVLVVTKDVWSLRLNTNFEYDGHLNRLVLNPSEWNVFGTHVSFGGLFVLAPFTYSAGALLEYPHLLGSRIRSILFGNVIFNRESGQPEGSFGAFAYGKPLYSATTKWGWDASVAWRKDIARLLVGADLVKYDSPNTSADDAIPAQYSREVLGAEYEWVRSFGRRYKTDLSFGFEALRRLYRPYGIEEMPVQPSAAALGDFVSTVLPVSDTRLSPFFQIASFSSAFQAAWNYETLGLQEDFRLGHQAILRVYPASRKLGSTRDLLGIFAGLGYTLPLKDGLLRLVAESTTEVARAGEHEGSIGVGARVFSPDVGFGRFVYDAVVINRYQNALNRRVALGGDTRLRGFRPEEFKGKDLIASNLEFRSAPVDILSAQVGGAAFYDLGAVFDGFESIPFKQSVGLGVRTLFAQANRSVFRLDYAVPLTAQGFAWPGGAFATFAQAFDPPGLRSPSVVQDVP